MKKVFLSILALAMSFVVMAAPRSVNEAQTIAKQFLTAPHAGGMKLAAAAPQLRLAHTATTEANTPAFYVFNNDNGGFVLVSADDNAREIIGYAENGAFDENNMPENMKVWFQHYAEEIAWAAANPTTEAAPAAKRSITPIAPLLGGIKWNQGKPYNNLCPIDKTDNTRAYTGCVATAASQIMRYWKYPEKGEGSHTNNWDNSGDYSGGIGKGKGSETANFGETTYDWDNMLESYSGSYTEAQANAVATLMYHVGISCNMIWGGDKVGGSGAYTSDMAKALYTYFRYDKGLRYIMKDYLGTQRFEELFLEELQAGRPILMGGATSNNEGHEFVCDGVDADGYFHINWGWGGMSDNYFSLSALDPDKQGAGGASSGQGFSIQVEAVIGIQPDKDNPLGVPLVAIEKYNNQHDYQFNKTAAKKTETILFQTELAYNSGPSDVEQAPIVFAIYKEDSTFVKAFGSNTFSMPALTPNYQSISLSSTFEGLEEGNYIMAIAFRTDEKQDWVPIPFVDEGEFRPFRATADSIYIGKAQGGGGDQPGGGGDLSDILDIGMLRYSTQEKMWVLALYNYDTYEPWIQCYFDSKSTNKVNGTYDMADALLLWPYADDEDTYNVATSGTLTLKRVDVQAYSLYPFYQIDLDFVTDANEHYTAHTVLDLVAYDDNKNEIELKDPLDGEGIENIVVSDSEKAVKLFHEGQFLIQKNGKIYNILGTKIK